MLSWKKTVIAMVLMMNMVVGVLGQNPNAPQQNQSTTTSSNSDNTTPTGAAKGVNPLGSYGGSNFDKVNLFNGNVSMSFPLASLTSRGGMSVGIVLGYNSKLWRVDKVETEKGRRQGEGTDNNTLITYHPVYDEVDRNLGQLAAGWTIHAGRMRGNQSVEIVKNDFTCVFPGGGTGAQKPKPKRTLTSFTFTSPDGTEYDFRDVIYDGQPKELVNCEGISRGKEFVSKDGTSATYISDAEVFDSLFGGQISSPNGPNGFVYLRDGSRFRIENGLVKQQRDRNGNIVKYTYDGDRLVEVQDNMGRKITVEYGLGNGILARVTIKGIGAVDRVTLVKGSKLVNHLATGQTRKNVDELFPVEEIVLANMGMSFNPKTVGEVTLPDGHKWEFLYNSYGEVVEVKTPASGKVRFEMGPSSTETSLTGGYIANLHEIFRRVVNRKTFPTNTEQIEGQVNYSDPRSTANIDGNQNLTVYQEEIDPNDNNKLLAKSSHKFSGHPTLNLKSPPFAYRPWLEGKELRTEQYNFDGTTVMRRSVTDYEQRAGVSWIAGSNTTLREQPENDPRVIRTTNSLLDGATPKTSKVEFQYDIFNNVTGEVLTGYENEIIRQVERSYVTTLNGINYPGLNVQAGNIDTHLKSLIASETIKNGQGMVETTSTYNYDQYNGTNNATLVARTLTVDSHATAYQSINRIHRGNVTSVTAGTGTAEATTIYSHYDVLGNVVEVVGPNANQRSETIYTAASQFTFPEQSKQYVEGGISGSRVLTSSRSFDFSTGAVLSSTGLNNDTTSFQYNDQLDRLTMETRPLGDAPGGFGKTTYAYSAPGDYPNTVTVETSLDQNGGRTLTSVSEFDGFLRTIRQTRTDGDSNTAPKVMSETFYDALGRVNKVSNPFRVGVSLTTDGYTTSKYDALSRVWMVETKTSDNISTGIVSTDYDTNLVTVTDQAGKQRKSETDAAGRLKHVYEPNPNNQALDQQTSYDYDARSNLLKVTQGIQIRNFGYDSLSRLTTATSPESGSATNGLTAYEYDKSSNLVKRTDPRGIVTNYSYDSINRLATKNYSDATPPVSYFYDVEPQALPLGVTKPTITDRGFVFQNTLGRATAIASAGTGRDPATGLFHTYDIGGRITKSSQLLDTKQYVTSSDYNLASLPTGHIYPSNRTIEHSYNIAGQITQVNSNSQIISELVKYTPSGAIESHKLGNGLYHQMKYNSRLQPTSITLGNGLTGQAAESIWKQEYHYAAYNLETINLATTAPNISINQAQNNGNIGHIRLTPGNGENPINQFFVYDELNRLLLAKEFALLPIQNGDGQIDIPITPVGASGQARIVTSEGTSIQYLNLPDTIANSGSASINIDLRDPDLIGKTVKINVELDLRTTIMNRNSGGTGSISGQVSVNGQQVISQDLFVTLNSDGQVTASNGIGDAIGAFTLGQQSTVDVTSSIGQVINVSYSFSSTNVFYTDPNTQQHFDLFGFDAFSALPSTTVEDGQGGTPQLEEKVSWSQRYGYDRFGNRKQVIGTQEQTLNISLFKNRITDPGYEYDLAGNVIADPSGKTYAYDAENRLIKVMSGTNVIAEYYYDAQGWRVRKVANGSTTRFVYDQGGRLLEEYDGEPVPASNAPTREHIYSPAGMLATVEPDKINYHTPDHLGSPRVLTDANGAVISRRDHLPFGEQLSDSIGNRSAIQGYSVVDSIRNKFTGYWRDQETDLDFAQARHFNGALGRFMQPDEFSGGPEEFYNFALNASQNPIFYANPADPQSLNKYQYCYNNPLLYTDSTGHQAVREFFDSLATTFVKDQGIEKGVTQLRGSSLPEVKSKAGAAVGHGLSAIYSAGEMIVGATGVVGGTTGGIVTSETGVGAVAGGAIAVASAGLVNKGATSFVNTVKNIFNSSNEETSSGAETDPVKSVEETKPGAPALKGDPYSPGEVSKRQSKLRKDLGLNPDPKTPIPEQSPGRNLKGTHSADTTEHHATGERNVGTKEEHSIKAKGSHGLPRR